MLFFPVWRVPGKRLHRFSFLSSDDFGVDYDVVVGLGDGGEDGVAVCALAVHNGLELLFGAHVAVACGQGMGYKAIADTLNTEGLKSKRGGTWHPQTVARVLERQ